MIRQTQEIIKIINSLAGAQSPYDVFNDWVECMALCFQNTCTLIHGKVWQERESRYIRTMQKYGDDGVGKFAEALSLLVQIMDEPRDYLGEIFMEGGYGNKYAGQFFTPFDLSRICAGLTMNKVDGQGIYHIYEPACGSGGMIIAAAAELQERGINYQKCMDVVAQDIDFRAVYMCYVQLSLLGIKAEVVQGSTLSEPYTGRNYPPEKVFRTPARMGLLVSA